MKGSIILLMMLLFCLPAKAQRKNGFYGKKMFVDVSVRGALPLIYSTLENSYYVASGSSNLSLGKDRLNYGYSGAIGYAFRKNKAVSLQVSHMFGNIAGPNQYAYKPSDALYNTEVFYFNMEHERLKVSTFIVMPVLHFSNNSNLLPIGVSHEFGVGYRTTRLVEDDYIKKVGVYYSSYTDQNGDYQQISLNTTQEATAFIDSLEKADGPILDYNRKYTGVSFTYALRIRRPFNESLALNTGFRYSFNLSREADKYAPSGALSNNFLNYHRYSIIVFDIGLTYIF